MGGKKKLVDTFENESDCLENRLLPTPPKGKKKKKIVSTYKHIQGEQIVRNA